MTTSSFALQYHLGSPFTSRTGLNNIVPVINQTPRHLKRANIRVKCMAEDDKKEVTPENLSQTPSTSPPPPPPPPPRAPKVSTKFEDILAFGGPAPERINGRLAMIGFVAAIGVELANGQDLFSQISEGGGLSWFVGSSVVLSLASLIPLFQGVRAEAKSSGLMTSDAELWNGRFAMLGLVALAFTEYLKGGAFV